MPNRYAIEANGLAREYALPDGEMIQAVRGIDLSIERGEIYILLGPNGAGKTTLFSMLNTLLLPTAGRARVAEKLAICQECPVQEACREWAVQIVIATQVKWEDCIIGGVRPAEINTEAARRYRPACGTRAGHRWHLANNEASCEPCRTANRMYERERVRRRKAAA